MDSLAPPNPTHWLGVDCKQCNESEGGQLRRAPVPHLDCSTDAKMPPGAAFFVPDLCEGLADNRAQPCKITGTLFMGVEPQSSKFRGSVACRYQGGSHASCARQQVHGNFLAPPHADDRIHRLMFPVKMRQVGD